ncbi:MAG: LuxR C-terminal-related transcriptional regulator [Steroidobacteraceae bacterium]|nr:LuxR C-terminal-related transcriptional regulator [Steroidobacteraceae bacterium]MDW8257833.1 LuxR C-terminal-related transcriptional regulator [Gammaproteobacteria bacterium]
MLRSYSAVDDTFRRQLEIALDRVADGVLLIDAVAHVLHINRQAREFLAKRRCSTTSGGMLSFVHPRTQYAFRRALICSHSSGTAALAPPREFLVLDETHTTVARAAVEPLRRTSLRDAGTFLVSLHPQPQDVLVSARTLESLYGLSPSEARVAAQVVNIGSLAELADRLGLSRNTVKAHLRQIFRKCEVRSLAQLTALIATGPGVRRAA